MSLDVLAEKGVPLDAQVARARRIEQLRARHADGGGVS
jgi:hypothetical protein